MFGSMAVALIPGGALTGFLCEERWRKGASATGFVLACLFVLANITSSQDPFNPPRIVLYVVTFWTPLVGGYLGSELARRRKGIRPPSRASVDG